MSLSVNMEKVTLNISGTKFVTLWNTLRRFPETRLGKLSKNSPHYDAQNDEFFFDKNPKLVMSILDLYRDGELHFPVDMCAVCIKHELVYWGVPEDLISECCWKRYTLGNEDKAIVDTIDRWMGTAPQMSDKHSLFKRISMTLEYPQYSKTAMVWNMINMVMVVIITVVVTIGTLEDLRIGIHELRMSNQTVKQLDILLFTDIMPWLYYVEIVCLIFFSLDMIARFLTSSSKKKFVKHWANIVDFIIDWIMWIAFFLDVAGDIIGHSYNIKIVIHILKALFCLNILRLWHFIRQYPMMKILILTFRASFKQLLLLLVGLTISVVVYATLIYFVELSMSVDTFPSIPMAIWWAVVTMTTVGYGDFVPQSTPGYIIGVLCSLSGILLLAMPVAIIASNFQAYYTNMSSRDQRKRRQTHLKKKAEFNAGFANTDQTELEDFNENEFHDLNGSMEKCKPVRNRVIPLDGNKEHLRL